MGQDTDFALKAFACSNHQSNGRHSRHLSRWLSMNESSHLLKENALQSRCEPSRQWQLLRKQIKSRLLESICHRCRVIVDDKEHPIQFQLSSSTHRIVLLESFSKLWHFVIVSKSRLSVSSKWKASHFQKRSWFDAATRPRNGCCSIHKTENDVTNSNCHFFIFTKRHSKNAFCHWTSHALMKSLDELHICSVVTCGGVTVEEAGEKQIGRGARREFMSGLFIVSPSWFIWWRF